MSTRLLVSLLLLAAACGKPLRITAPYCSPPSGDLSQSLSAGEPLPAGTPRETQLAALLGVGAAVEERAQGPLSLERRVEVLQRLELARLEISALTAELDCEGERTQQAADYLSQRQAKRVQAITVASIVTATAVGVASVLLSTGDRPAPVQNAVGITGAAAAAGLGFATLYVSPKLHFEHARNLLRDVWEGPAVSSVYPPIVWAYLSRPEFSNDQDAAIRSKLVARFCALNDRCDDPAIVTLLFEQGGEFDVDALRAQSALLDQVKAEVDLQNQDLKVLADRLLR